MGISKKKYVQRSALIAVIVLIIYSLISGLMYLRSNHQSQSLIFENTAMDIPVGEITSGVVVEQTIPINEKINGISVLFATYAREDSGEVYVQIIGMDSGDVYLDKQLAASAFEDNAYVTLPFEKFAEPKTDSSVCLKVSSDGVSGSSITIWSSEEDTIPDGMLTINGQQQAGDLAIRTFIAASTPYWNLARVFQICYILVVSALLPYMLPSKEAIFSDNTAERKQIGNEKKLSKSGIAAAALFALCGIMFLVLIYRNLHGAYTELQSSRWEFYALVLLLTFAIGLATKHDAKFMYCLIILLGFVWLILDKGLNIIDEGGHLSIINHIIDYGSFPTIQDNYEAVQGPIYYYLMAVLMGLLPVGARMYAARFFGLVCLVLFGYLSKSLLNELKQAGMISVPSGLCNILLSRKHYISVKGKSFYTMGLVNI